MKTAIVYNATLHFGIPAPETSSSARCWYQRRVLTVHVACRGGRVVAGYWSLGATREVGGFVLSAGLLDAGSGLGMDLRGDVCVKGCIAVIAAGYITCSTMPAAP